MYKYKITVFKNGGQKTTVANLERNRTSLMNDLRDDLASTNDRMVRDFDNLLVAGKPDMINVDEITNNKQEG